MWHPPQFEPLTAKQANEFNHQPLNDVRMPDFSPHRSVESVTFPQHARSSRNPNVRASLDGRVGSMGSAVGASRADYVDSFKNPTIAQPANPVPVTVASSKPIIPSVHRPNPGAFLNLPGLPAQFVGCPRGVHNANAQPGRTDIIVGTRRFS